MRKISVAVLSLCVALLLVACTSRSPQERLEKVGKLFQQGDYLGARLEAKELILKYPESEEAIVARFVLAQIYNADGQPDEAISELDQILARKSQKDPQGVQALGFTIDILKRTKRFDDATKLIETYQKKYADDPVTSLQLSVARADVLAVAGETTQARAIIQSFLSVSTSPLERRQYRHLLGQTFLRDQDFEAGARCFEELFTSADTPEDKRDVALRTAWFWAAAENYEKAREWAEKTTELFAQAIKEELDGREKARLVHILARVYQQIGNLEGARQLLHALYEMPALEPEQLGAVINELVVTLLRQGKADDAIAFVQDAAKRFPQSPLAQQALQMETLKSQGKFDTIDTSPLVMRFQADPLIRIDPKLLALDEEETTPSARAAEEGHTTAPSEAVAVSAQPSQKEEETTE